MKHPGPGGSKYLKQIHEILVLIGHLVLYSKICLKRPIKKGKKGRNDRWYLNEGQSIAAFCNTFDLH